MNNAGKNSVPVSDPLAFLAGSALDLPFQDDPTVPASSPLRPGDDRPLVLVADDNADMRQYIVRLLGQHYRTEAVSDGEAALAAARARTPDLVLTDVMMPRQGGLALLQALRADPRTSGVPVIMLSVRAGEENRIEGMQEGADDYLLKPFSARELLARVGAHLQMARLRREASESIRAIEERFRALVSATSDVIYLMSADWTEMRHLQGREFIADTHEPSRSWLLKYILQDDHPHVMAAINAAIRSKGVFELEHRVVRVDGTLGWTFSRAIPLFDGNGEIVEWFGAASDVTAQKQVDDERRRQETFTSGILGSITDGFGVVCKDWRFTFANDELIRRIGKQRHEILCNAMWEMFPDAVGNHAYVQLHRAMAERVAVEYEVYYEPWQRWFLDKAFPTADGGLAVYSRDITDRKRDEAARHEMERNYQALAAASSEVAYRMSADWSTMLPLDGRELFVSSDRPLADWGWVDPFLPRDEHARVRQAIREAIAGKKLFEMEHRVLRLDGSTGWVRSRSVPILDENEEIVEWFGVASDITELKRAEEARQEMERNYRALAAASSEIGYRMSADWSTMLPLDGRQLVASSDQPVPDWAWLDLNLPCDEHPRVRQAINEAIARKTLFELEHRVRRPDGSIGWTLSRAVPILDENEDVISWFGAASDITDRKQAEEALWASEARLRRVFESNVIGMIRWDLDRSLILDANAEFLRMTGYVRDDVTSGRLNFRDLTPPEWAARNEEGIRAIRADGHAPPYEKEYFRKDGSRLPLIIAGTRFEDSQSEGISFLIDLSEMKRAEAELQAHADRHSYLVKLADTLRPLSDPAEVQAEAGRVLGERLGASRVYYFEVGSDDYVIERDYTNAALSMVGRYPITSFGPNPLAALRAGCTTSEADVNALPARTPEEKAAFAGLQIRSYIAVPLVKGGTFVAGLAVHGDSVREWTPTEIAITEDTAERTWAAVERVRAETALRASEARRRLALDASELGMWHVDPVTRATTTDARYRAIFGTTEEWTDYLQAVAVIHPDDQPAVLEAVAAATRLEDPTPYAIEYRIVHPDGSLRWILANGRASFEGTDPTRRVASFDGTVADITDRKRSEEERERLVAQLQEQDQRKDEFLATLAHELRNPLAPIRNALQIMRLVSGDASATERIRSMMERQVGQMVHLVDDLLDMSRISRGKIELRKERIELGRATEQAIEANRPSFEKAVHELLIDIPPEPIYVDADLTRLTQVFSNLLDNAAKFTERGGLVRLAVQLVGLDVVVSVTDNGIGIPTHMLPRVFEMFTQVDGNLGRSHSGLGIGLSIVQKLVQMHGGSVEARSGGSGKGSEFVVRLPVALPVALNQPADEANPVRPAARLRILVADDNVDAAESLAMLLTLDGNETQMAHDGLAALEVAATFRPDVLLLDIGMPKLNGYDVCRRIRQQAWGKTMVVIALTGWGQEDDRRKSQAAGFDFHLVKPVDLDVLNNLLAGVTAKVS